MVIRGGNLGEEVGEYKLLSQHEVFDTQRQDILKWLEKSYLKSVEEAQSSEIRPIEQKDGKVVIRKGMIVHSCSGSIDSLESISRLGILASEWFGVKECQKEGGFCAFVSRIHDEECSDESRQVKARMYNAKQFMGEGKRISLFFDDTNPVMQKLLHMDYFEYEKVKQLTPEKIHEIYSCEEVELMDALIEPNAPGGRLYHIRAFLPFCDWSAIPGGIPSALVNGICIKHKKYDQEYIEQLAVLFPNATIFNGDLEIIHMPKREERKSGFLESIRVSPEEAIENLHQYEESKVYQRY